jgi:CysZ protein
MIDAAVKALSQMLTQPLRAVLLKAIGLALLLIVVVAITIQRALNSLAETGLDHMSKVYGSVPHGLWDALFWITSMMATLTLITGAVLLMPLIAALVGSFFVDEVAEKVELKYYPAEPPGKALPFLRAVIEGLQIALLALLVYLCALPFVLLAGLGVVILFLANAYLLSREYFELAAMRFRTPAEAKAMRKANAGYVFLSGMVIALFVSIPLLNLATPIFAMTFMVHIHKGVAGKRVELIAPAR